MVIAAGEDAAEGYRPCRFKVLKIEGSTRFAGFDEMVFFAEI